MDQLNKIDYMSKSVLVMDTPKTCLDCMFCFELDEGINACCSVMSDENDKSLCRDIQCDGGYCQNKPKWCPLKEIPGEENNEYYFDEYSDGYDDGWNAFRAKILGENKNV